jgi:hypothetical protein
MSGSYVDWQSSRPFRLPIFSSRSIGSASKGDFFGIALVGEKLYSSVRPWLTLTQARSTPCHFAGSCTREVDPTLHFDGAQFDPNGSVVFPAGRYRVAMLGSPGAAVTVQLPVTGQGKPVKTARKGRLALGPVASTFPGAGAQQPAGQGSVLLKHRSTTISVMAIRIDTAQAVRGSYGYCVSGGTATWPWLATCSNGKSSAHMGATIDYETCAPGVPACAPIGAGSHTSTVLLGDVREGATFFGFDTQVVAASSRVSATVLTLGL